MRLKVWIVISHAKLQVNVWIFVSGWKWYSGIKDGLPPLRSSLLSCESSVPVKENPDRKRNWYCYNQKQSSGAVLQKCCFYKFRKSHKKRPKRFRRRRFLVNSAKFLITSYLKNPLDGCFCINTRSVYCTTTTFRLIKNDVTHNFWLSIFSG